MMLSKMLPLMILPAALLSGCEKIQPSEPAPLFCDHAELRRFSQAEIDWRAVNAPTNLRKDIAQNEKRKLWCVEAVEG